MRNKEELKKWFPALYRSGEAGTKAEGKPSLRIICFPPAGCAEDLFSTEGTGSRNATSPLLEWARSNAGEVLSVQYPGRGNRKDESAATSIKDIVDPLYSVLASYFHEDGDNDVPYVIIAHSVGSWIAYELLQTVRTRAKLFKDFPMAKLKEPTQVYFSAFPCPSIPEKERPWSINERLSDSDFKAECRRWNINEAVFKMWDVYEPMLRADFTLFDQYDFEHSDKDKFTWPLMVFWAKEDGMITKRMVKSWETQTSSRFEYMENEGHHLFPLQKVNKAIWLEDIAKDLDNVMEVVELLDIYGGTVM